MPVTDPSAVAPDAEHPTRSEIDVPKLLYSIAEAAALLSLSRAHLYRLLGRGELASLWSGRSRRISHVDLEAYVERLRATASGSDD
jgi:excisionase family DNA binding protein